MDQSAGDVKKSGEVFRMRLQIETLLLVWVRTSLALMGFGFVVARFGLFLREIAQVTELRLKAHPKLAGMSTLTGTILIVLGVVVLILSVITHQSWVTRLERGDVPTPSRWSLGAILSLILAALGMGLAAYLAAVD